MRSTRARLMVLLLGSVLVVSSLLLLDFNGERLVPQEAVDTGNVKGGTKTKHGLLLTSPSPLKLLGTGVKYPGRPLVGYRSGRYGKTVEIGGLEYYRGMIPDTLIMENPKTKQAVEFPMFDLAISAGWYGREKEGEYLPQSIRGLHRQDSFLWMGSNGVGILAYDTRSGTWTRYDVKDAPVPGDHMDVHFADSDYVLASCGSHWEEPRIIEPCLNVFSTKHKKWLRVDAIPSEDALSLGFAPSPWSVSVYFDYRPYAKQEYVPIGGGQTPSLARPHEVVTEPGGSYVLRYPHGEGSKTELRLRRDLIEAAFAEAVNPHPETEDAKQPQH